MRLKVWLLFVTVLISFKLLAQSNACDDILLPALEQISNVCQATGRNEICYGNNEVVASFRGDTPITFANPSDIAPVPLLDSLHTSAYDSVTGRFGVAMMQVQASNIPNTLPGQVLTFLLIGDVAVQNAVSPEEAFIPVDPISVSTRTAANIRVQPSSNSAVAWSVTESSSLAIDARNEAGDWFRVVGAERTGWVSTTVLVQNDAMSALPVYTHDSRSPMQAFYFSAGIGRPNCEQAPNQLLIQGPHNSETSLTINGAEVRIGSTIVLSQPAENVLRVSVLDGEAVVNQITVPSGFSIDAPLGESGIQPNNWENFQPLAPQELEFHRKTSGALDEEVLSYVPDVPTVEEVQVIEEAIAPQPTAIPTEIPGAEVTDVGESGGGDGSVSTVAPPPPPPCYTNGSISFELAGAMNTWGNRRMYSNTTCTGSSYIDNAHAVISASNSTEAGNTCFGSLGGGYIAYYQDFGWNTPSGWYECGH